jgi:hypothetical protein
LHRCLKFYLAGHLGDALAQNEIAKRGLAIALYAERNAQTTDYDRALRDTRIAALETTLDFIGRAAVRQAAGERVDPTIAQRADNVRALSPHQERLLRDIANAIPPSLTKDRITIELLQQRGIITLVKGTTPHVALTDVGYEVRAELHDTFSLR